MGLGPFVEGETLVFFDEIQECPNARTAIKFLVEEAKFDYIESGSLLGISYKDIPSYPVGFEDEVMVYPFDFGEFLWAAGVDMEVVALIKDCFINKTPVPAAIHEPEIPFGPQAPLFPTSAVFSVSAVIPERAAPFRKMRQRRAEPPAHEGTKTSRSRKLYKDGSFTK